MKRDTARHEYEVEFVYPGPMYFVGYAEKTALRKAAELIRGRGARKARLYHTYPSPGPVRRYVGTVTETGQLQRAL